jgi:hypothetical protein
MVTTARDESTRLRTLVRDGWQVPDQHLTVVQAYKIGECHVGDASSTRVTVNFEVLGRLVHAGSAGRVAFQAGARRADRELDIVSIDGVAKVEDLRSLESHVEPAYAIRMLTELAQSEPAAKAKCDAIIARLRHLTGARGIRATAR